jgi:hypothetical protein
VRITNLIIHFFIGVVSAFAFIAVARRCGIAWEKKIYAVGLFLAALIYVGFAAVSGASSMWRSIELMGLGFFTLVAVLGLRFSVLFLAAGWAVHGLWDALLHLTQHTTFVPDWYPVICLGFDLIVAIYIAARFKTQSDIREIG